MISTDCFDVFLFFVRSACCSGVCMCLSRTPRILNLSLMFGAQDGGGGGGLGALHAAARDGDARMVSCSNDRSAYPRSHKNLVDGVRGK